MKKCSHVLPPVLVPEPAKANPLGLAGGGEESLFQKELSEGSEGGAEYRKGRNEPLAEKSVAFFPGLKKEQSMSNG